MRTVDREKHDARRHEILEAAVRCFARRGFHGSTIANLCAEAQMSAGHLYHYFPSKEAIVEAMVAANLERAASAFEEAARDRTSTLDVIVAQFAQDGSDERRRAPLLFDMLAEAARTPMIAAALHEHSRGMAVLLADLLRRGQTSGEIDPSVDPERIAPILISLMDGSRSVALRTPNFPPEDARRAFRLLLARFLGAQA